MPRRTYSRRAGRRRAMHIGLDVDRILDELRQMHLTRQSRQQREANR